MYSRLVPSMIFNNVSKIKKEIDKNPTAVVFFLGTDAYLMKLNLNIPINPFDNINNGNMGYHGVKNYILKIKKTCNDNKCMFVFNDDEATGKRSTQTNQILLNYIKNNYKQYYSSASFDLYKNF